MTQGSMEDRLQRLEDQIAIYQVINAYGYAADGVNAYVVEDCYVEDGVYAIGDTGEFKGREQIKEILTRDGHLDFVKAGCAHISSVPHVVIDGDAAVATCHTMVASHRIDGFFIARLSASRIELVREADGCWRIRRRQNYLLDGDQAASALLGRLKEGPQAVPFG